MKDSPPINTTISRYLVLSKLGAGGMGEVYLAEDTSLKPKVALKFLPTSLLADDRGGAVGHSA
jgi:hypothetical protein